MFVKEAEPIPGYSAAMTDTPSRATIDALRRASVAQLLLQAGRLVDERALAAVRGRPGAPAVRPAHTKLFPHVTREGVRLTELARRVGVTKQAVQPLVAELAAWGFVEVVPDPTDGRARLVRWTDAGLRGILDGLAVLAALDAALEGRVGAARWAALREALAEVVDALDADPG